MVIGCSLDCELISSNWKCDNSGSYPLDISSALSYCTNTAQDGKYTGDIGSYQTFELVGDGTDYADSLDIASRVIEEECDMGTDADHGCDEFGRIVTSPTYNCKHYVSELTAEVPTFRSWCQTDAFRRRLDDHLRILTHSDVAYTYYHELPSGRPMYQNRTVEIGTMGQPSA